MKAISYLQRLFSRCAVCVGLAAVQAGTNQAGTSEADLSKDLNHSAFSTTSIRAELTTNKPAISAEITPSRSNLLVSSQSGAFQYNWETQQTTSARKLSEEIRAAQQLENQRNTEITEHPFWYARFWTHSPLAIPAFLLGGDHHALETPPSEFEKLGAASYGDQAEVRKFEGAVGFGNLSQGDSK
jgi:hypothetical protein